MNKADESVESKTDLFVETGEADVAAAAVAGAARPEVSRHRAMTLPRWRGFLLCLAAVYSQVRSRCSHWLHLRSRAPLQRTFLSLQALQATEARFVVDADGTGAEGGADTGRSFISTRTVRAIAHSTMVVLLGSSRRRPGMDLSLFLAQGWTSCGGFSLIGLQLVFCHMLMTISLIHWMD